MASFEIEPRGPFTLASAARFIAGWPPGRVDTSDDAVRLHFLVDDWSGPARVVLTQRGDTVHGSVEADNEDARGLRDRTWVSVLMRSSA